MLTSVMDKKYLLMLAAKEVFVIIAVSSWLSAIRRIVKGSYIAGFTMIGSLLRFSRW